MQVDKSDIMKIFELREEELKEKLKLTSCSSFEEFNKSRLWECLYLKQIISLTWDIIHKKKERKNEEKKLSV